MDRVSGIVPLPIGRKGLDKNDPYKVRKYYNKKTRRLQAFILNFIFIISCRYSKKFLSPLYSINFCFSRL